MNGVQAGLEIMRAQVMPRYGKPVLTEPRLGQGAFRVLVTHACGRRCAMTQERTLPVLEAAHIRPYRQNGPHDIRNGLCLRSDLHRLLDKGYLTIDPDDRRIVVSRRIKDEYDNGEEYHGRLLMPPADPAAIPSRQYLPFHAEHVFG